MLLAWEVAGQPVDALLVTMARDDHVDPLLVSRVSRVQRFAAMVEIELVRGGTGQSRREVALERGRHGLIILVAQRLAVGIDDQRPMRRHHAGTAEYLRV